MLACARIGATHSVVFGGFSADSIKDRLEDSEAVAIITADGGYRRGKVVPLKDTVDEALKRDKNVKSVIVYKHAGNDIKMKKGRDLDWATEEAKVENVKERKNQRCCVPLFLLLLCVLYC